MKKALFILISFFIGATSFAQINKGQYLVGGNAAFSGYDDNGHKSSQLTIAPNAGYFFINKLAGGLKLNLGYGSFKISGEKATTSSYGVSPFVRYYILPAANKVNLFAQASYGWNKSRNKYPDYTSRSTFNSYSFAAGPAFFVTPNISVELTAGYTNSQYKNKNYDNTTSKSKEKLFQVGVGFQIHLGNGKK